MYIRTLRSKKLHPEHSKLINEAIRHNAKGGDKNLQISYKKENGEVSERKVKPLAVKGKNLFVAHCHERNAIRSFRVERIGMVKSAFWNGFEKRAESITDRLNTDGEKLERVGKKMRMWYLGVPAAIAAGVMTKSPLLRTGATAAGIGSGIVGYAGERSLGYGRGLQTISNHLQGKRTSEQDWDNLIMNNPSGSLIRHVPKDMRPELAKKWSDEFARFHGANKISNEMR
jgi:hypothetical protein